MILTNDFQTDAKNLKFEVESLLNSKLSALPNKLSTFIRFRCVLSGGCFASLMKNEVVNDLDFWCLDEADLLDMDKLLQEYTEKDAELIECENPKYMEQFVDGKISTINATTLKNGIQLIKITNYAKAKETFDFEHCRVSYIPSSRILYMSKTQYNSIIEKVLIPTKAAPYSANINARILKFQARGWK